MFSDQFLEDSLTSSSSVDDSVKSVAMARTEFCSFLLWLLEDDELLLFLVCIALSAFVIPLIFATTLVKRALLSCLLVDNAARSVAAKLS